jgi:hypothetical protein
MKKIQAFVLWFLLLVFTRGLTKSREKEPYQDKNAEKFLPKMDHA